MMNMQWITGGIVLLGSALILKNFQQQGSFQTLIMSFIFFWSGFAALHFWGLIKHVIVNFVQPDIGSGTLAIGIYWLVFTAAALPGVILWKSWIRNHKTTFPPAIDSLLLWTLSLGTAFMFACLVLMSVSIYTSDTAAETQTPAEEALHRLAKMPLRLYLAVAEPGSDSAMARPFETLPAPARNLLLSSTQR